MLCIARVSIDFSTQTIQDHILLLSCILEVADERVQFRLEREHGTGCRGFTIKSFTTSIRQCYELISFKVLLQDRPDFSPVLNSH